MANYVNFPMGDLGAGIDALSAENKIPEGFSESLVNVEPTPEGYLRKRTGYSSASGYVPFRISSVNATASNDRLCFNIDSGIDSTKVDFSTTRSSPIVVSGYVLQDGVAPTGDFSSQNTIYYSGFSPDIRFSFTSGTSTHTIPGSVHGLGEKLFVGVAYSNSSIDSSNSPFIPGEAIVTISNSDVTVEYTNGGAAFDGFIYLMSGEAVTGSVYNDTGLFSSWAGTPPAQRTLTITAATHGLNNSNILPVLYEGDGSTWRELAFADYAIANNGDVVVTLDSTPTLPNYLVILKAAPASNALSITVPANSSTVLGTAVTGDYLVYSVYETTDTSRVKVIPDGVTLSVPNELVSFSLTNSGSSPKLFTVYFDYGDIITNRICVTSTTPISADYDSSKVQLTLWGLDHATSYSGESAHAGWVNHIDNYRTEIGEQLISGLGGNLFTPGDSGLLGAAFPRLRNRVGSNTVIGPAFSSSSSRTRGYVSFSGAGEGYARASTIEWISGNSVSYTLETPNRSVVGTPISTTSGTEDWLTVSQAANPVNNGLFRITSVSYPTADTMQITVTNPQLDSSDYDEQDCGAQAGVFTDQLPVSAASEYVPGDTIVADGLSAALPLTVLSGDASTVVVRDVYEGVVFSAFLRITGARTSSIVPLRDLEGTSGSSNFVIGDTVSYTGLERLPQITQIFPYSQVTLSSVVAVNGTATCTMGSLTTDVLSVGQRILLVQGGVFSGEHTISSIVSSTQFTFDTELVASNSAVLAGHWIQLNETLPWQDTPNSTTSISVPSRWVPIESPRDSFNLTPKSVVSYFDANAYVEQPILRSVMSGNNMYFTNGDDEVYKFDGVHNYRAGLPRWQPQLFVSVDTTSTAKIIVNLPTIEAGDVVAVSGSAGQGPNIWKVELGQEAKFVAGQPIVIRDSSFNIATEVVSTYRDATHGYIKTNYVGVIPSFTAVDTTITLNGRYRYYFRLSARDINDNIIATAATGADDYIVTVTEDASIRLRLVGLPALGNYDYKNIKIEIYRTKLATTAPFYLISTLSVPFNKINGYVDFVDTESDDTLTQLDVLSNFTGANLGTGLSEPIRAKYITSVDNRLVLANVKDYAKLTITFQDVGNTVAGSYNTQRMLFRKDSSDTDITTDNLNRMAYEWRNTGQTPVTGIADLGGGLYRVTSTAYTLTVGNWVYLYRNTTSNGADLLFSGWHQVVSVDGGGTTFDIQLPAAGYVWASGTSVNTAAKATNAEDIPVVLSDDYNYNTINGNKATSTNVNLLALKRLTDAINATQRVCQTNGFSPWMTAAGGAEFGNTIVVSSPSAVDTFLEVVLPTPAIAGVAFYVNNVEQLPGAAVESVVQIFSSRVVVSYDRLPEIFDRPTGSETSTSLVFDVNPADGQSITGCIPFFGDSAFGAANTSGVLVVFKTNSIYLIDVVGNSINNSRIQKIDSRGIGCTAPFSIAPTQNGIMFATSSGIYRVKRDLTVEYVGRKLERLWQSKVDRNYLSEATGHYYSVGNQYKLSVPVTGGPASNTEALVYNTVREYQADGYRTGSWTTYTNVAASGWCNNSDSAFFASTSGDVFYVEKTTDERPYRDQGEAISAVATLRSLDFGDASIRKAVSKVMVDYRTMDDDTTTSLATAIDNNTNFQEADIAIVRDTNTDDDGLGSTGEVKIRTIRYSIDRRKGVYFQMQFSNEELDSSMEIAGVSVRVGGLSDRGTTEAKSTQ